MTRGTRLLVAGDGQWGRRVQSVGIEQGMTVTLISDLRARSGENDNDHLARLTVTLASWDPDLVWVAVPPSRSSVLLTKAAIACGCDVILEKPWMGSRKDAETIAADAEAAGLRIRVHFEYIFLAGLNQASVHLALGRDLRFDGAFEILSAGRHGLAPEHNLGSHLRAIHQVYFPHAEIGTLTCSYEAPTPCRWIQLSDSKKVMYRLDFVDSAEPVIQRFLRAFLSSAEGPDRVHKVQPSIQLAERIRSAIDSQERC